MSESTESLPLKFDLALRYVKDKLQTGHNLAKAILKSLDFKSGHFFALLHSTADRGKIHDFRAGGILPANPLEPVIFSGKIYPGRKKGQSIHELAQHLKRILLPGQCCFFEDLIHNKSDPIKPEIKKHAVYLRDEVYLYMNQNEFSLPIAEKLIHFADAQWYYMNVVSSEEFEASSDMTEEKLQKIASKTTHISVGAYDMEGFVVWERST